MRISPIAISIVAATVLLSGGFASASPKQQDAAKAAHAPETTAPAPVTGAPDPTLPNQRKFTVQVTPGDLQTVAIMASQFGHACGVSDAEVQVCQAAIAAHMLVVSLQRQVAVQEQEAARKQIVDEAKAASATGKKEKCLPGANCSVGQTGGVSNGTIIVNEK